MSMYAVEVHELTKRFRRLVAVDHVSFQVQKGISFGLLGLNGAGKTTTFKMLATLIRPDGGTALVSGSDIRRDPLEVRRSIGYVPENPSFYTRMTTMETMMYFCRLLEIPSETRKQRISQCLELVGLVDKTDSYVGGYSRGMRHRLALAQALLAEPTVLFLDEPTLGLDPLGARNMRELIMQLKRDHNVTILMSSHTLPEVEMICDEVGIFHNGQLVAQDSVENLRHTASDTTSIEVELASRPEEQAVISLRRLPGINQVERDGRRLLIEAKNDHELRPRILETILAAHQDVLFFGARETSLEDILLRILQDESETAS